VEDVFIGEAHLLNLHIAGKVIQTTDEHPFWVKGRGWTAAADLFRGDLLRSHDGQWVAVEEIFDNGEFATVYNLLVADYHTYFVGTEDWGFSIWAHNACVTRWGRPGLESGDWVMAGGKNWWNYFWSGKWQPGFGNKFAAYATGETFDVAGSTLRWP